MKLGDIIHSYRENNDMSMSEFAKRANVSKAYIGFLEKGVNPKTGRDFAPSIKTIQSVAKAMCMDFDELFNMLDGDVSLNRAPSSSSAAVSNVQEKGHSAPASDSASDSTTSQLPTAFHALHGAPLPMLKNRAEIIALIDRYPDVHDVKKKSAPVYRAIACGEPIFMQEQCDTYALIDADIDIDFCIIAKGESMTGARIQDGDIVFIKRCSMVDNGDIAAVAIDDTATLKRVYYDHDAGQLILQAENPAYAPMVYRGEELNNIIILGKAMYFQSAVR